MIAERPTVFDNDTIPFTISMGVAAMVPGQDSNSLIKAADENLYAAKRGGRNRVVPSLAELLPG
jgi:diguanylate cyclase (GGDEF)-like protein